MCSYSSVCITVDLCKRTIVAFEKSHIHSVVGSNDHHFYLLVGFLLDRVLGVDPEGGEARLGEQQDLLHEPVSSLHQRAL